MSEYDYFMVYALDGDSGEKVRLDVSDQAELRNILDPEQVFVIVQEELRRIYIWKGAKSPVRKRFISSRVAQALQEELVKQAAFHRCKIISIDQGDEVTEFLTAFNLESMEVTEKLADVRYIRNIDREKMLDQGIIPEEGFKVVAVDNENQEKPTTSTTSTKKTVIPKKAAPVKKYMPPPMKSYGEAKPAPSMAEKERKSIMEKIIKEEIPDNLKRQNLIIGHTLYGAVSKTVKVFGKEIVETEWEPVQNVPKGMMEIDDRILRVYFDEEKGIVEAIEILVQNGGEKAAPAEKTLDKKPASTKAPAEKQLVEELEPTIKLKPAEERDTLNYDSWGVKDLRTECIKMKLQIPVNARKGDLIKLLKEHEAEDTPASAGRRKLPSIPKE